MLNNYNPNSNIDENNWLEVVTSERSLFDINIKQIWQYRDLLYMFIKRDFVAVYKQTVLGPIWFFIKPLFTTIVFTIIFGKLAKLSTENIPHILFYMSGITFWAYFSDCLNNTAIVFRANQSVFGKVYFPRLISPLSLVISGLLKFSIQLLMFILIFLYFILFKTTPVSPNLYILLFPLLVLILAGLGLGFGLIVTSLTTKYRDIYFLLSFSLQLFMYATPVIYPLSALPEKYRFFMALNPMTSILETFRYSFFGCGTFSWLHLLYSFFFTTFLLLIGVLIFNRTEQNFMDTV
ncbi:MAG: ABC transporter permease [Planctomycetota bacterium]|jgi:lipopolysaccharide transport system permease protein